MADPISIGVTVSHVVQAISQASGLLYGYVASVRHADASCQSLLDQLIAVGGILNTVMAIEKDDSLPPGLSHALSLLMAPSGPVAQLHVELKKILPNEQAQESGKMNMFDRMKWPFKQTKASESIAKLKSYCGEIAHILTIDTWRTLKDVKLELQQVGETLQEGNRGIEELKKDSAAQKVREQAEERQKFLEWMSPVSCTEKHDTSRDQRTSETGVWIFDANEYKIWNKPECALSMVEWPAWTRKDNPCKIKGSDEAEPQTLAYFYCNFGDDRTTNAAAVLRSLIVQLLQQSKDDWITKIGKQQESNTEGDLDSLRDLWQQNQNAKPYPTHLGFLRKLLVEASTLVRRQNRPAVLVIDALDECKDYSKLVGHLVNLAKDAQLRLLVTSRSEPDIQDAFHDLPTVSLKDSAGQTKADICTHINEQLTAHTKFSDELKKTVLEKLLEKAEGMFRWVQCQLDVIMTCKRQIDIEAALGNLPAELYETYARIIQAIKLRGPSDDQIARSCLLWLAGTFTPLTLDQLNEAMMIEVGQLNLNPARGVMDLMDIVVACGSLVTYNEKTGVVALSHYSVKEYLISRPNEIIKSISDMHARICELLITYVLCDFVDEICVEDTHPALRRPGLFASGADVQVTDVNKDHPLLSYAILGWKHLRHVSDVDPDVMVALSRLNSEFLRNTKKRRVLATQHETPVLQPTTDRWLSAAVTLPSLLFIPLEHGKPWMVEFIVKQHSDLLDVDIAPGWGSPLIFAIAKDRDCLTILLEPGVHLNKLSSINPRLYSQPIPDGSYAPISWAAAIGSKDTVNFLLSRTEVNIPNNILHMAVRASKPSHEFIRQFRQRGADVNFTVNGSTPLHYFLSTHPNRLSNESYESQLQPIVEELVEPSFNLSLQDQTARTVLHIALDGHLGGVVAYLLEKNAGLSATATLLPDMWSWATNKAWFPDVQAAALAAHQPWASIKAKVDATTKTVEFSVAGIPDRDNPNPICAVVISAIRNSKVLSYNSVNANLSYRNQSFQKEIQDSVKDDSLILKFDFSWESGQRVSSRLFDCRQEEKFIRMLQQLIEDEDSADTSLFLRMSNRGRFTGIFQHEIECVLGIYRGPLPLKS
ncbi:hypothetical protein EV702DRAFT_1195824 [Suillus placidus]|uniref:NACHT domain-containing protein n=1 Tax=Suillus placidus TaxID=48579 RepID=A0A9P6ZXT0_9AGAM|nr:hypothetical protein EV702DRAFT_1195824 [Suillus placidus]